MVCTGNQENKSIFADLQVKKTSKDRLTCGNVLFVDNGKSVVVTMGRWCRLFSATTGEHAKDLFKCKEEIVSCDVHPRNPQLLLAVTASGGCTVYNMLKDEKIKTFKLRLSADLLNSLKVPKFHGIRNKTDCDENFKWDDDLLKTKGNVRFHYSIPFVADSISKLLIWASWSLKDEHQSHISVFSNMTGEQMKKVAIPKVGLKRCYKNFIISNTLENDLILLCMGGHYVCVCRYEKHLHKFTSRSHKLGKNVKLSSVAFHPTSCSFATADSHGVITVWHNIFDAYPVRGTYQWHTQRVRDMAFSGEGSHLFSGGDEHVLVKWSFLSDRKDFLPRLSSSISYITTAKNAPLIALSLGNNEIVIIDPNLEKVCVILEYVVEDEKGKQGNVLTSDPRTDSLVLNGKPGFLQFLSRDAGNFLYSVDVAGVNYMTGDAVVVNANVTHARFNKNGSWLVTVESRKDRLFAECHLKFWQYDEGKQTFVLNTNMESPHDESDVNHVAISGDDTVATSGSDGQFKCWAPFETEAKTIWSFLSAGRYRKQPCGPLDFSKDSTLVAACFGPTLTLWCTSTCSLKCSLTPPFKRRHLTFVKFGSDEHSHFIVTATATDVTAWNIITLATTWVVNLEVSYLVGDFFDSHMCVVSKSNKLYIFTPFSPAPEFCVDIPSSSPIVAAHYQPRRNRPGSLHLLNSDRDLFLATCREEDSEAKMPEMAAPAAAATTTTPLSAQLAEKSRKGIMKSISKYRVSTRSRNDANFVSSILDAPACALPNPVKFCSNFLASLAVSVDKSETKSSDATESQTRSSERDRGVATVANKPANKVRDPNADQELWNVVNSIFT